MKITLVTEEVQRAGKDQDCLFCAVISHGSLNGRILTKDEPVFVNYFTLHFTERHLPILAGKPKILLILVSLV